MTKFCKNCGNKLEEGQQVCLGCGSLVDDNNNKKEANRTSNGSVGKSKIAAGVLALFLGSLGVHNFYLGYTGKGVAQLLLTTVGWIFCFGPAISSIWALVEAILIFTGSISTDAEGNPLVN